MSRPPTSMSPRLIEFVRGWDRAAPLVGALLCRHQPLDRRRLRGRLRAQSRPRRARDRAGAAPRLADRDAQHPHRVARRPRCSGATAAWSRRSRRSATGRWPTRASRSGWIWSSRRRADRGAAAKQLHIPHASRPSPRSRSASPPRSSRSRTRSRRSWSPATAARGADDRAGLPFGPFDPLAHRTFEMGLRAWVEAQTGLAVGYVEQLYTFGDRGRHARPDDTGAHMVSIGYLALTPHARERRGAARGRRRLRAVVPLLPVGGLARAAARDPRQGRAAAARRMGGPLRQAGARPRARPARAAAAVLRRRRQPVGRGEGARPLRAALRRPA